MNAQPAQFAEALADLEAGRNPNLPIVIGGCDSSIFEGRFSVDGFVFEIYDRTATWHTADAWSADAPAAELSDRQIATLRQMVAADDDRILPYGDTDQWAAQMGIR